jgi:hypothetical protein
MFLLFDLMADAKDMMGNFVCSEPLMKCYLTGSLHGFHVAAVLFFLSAYVQCPLRFTYWHSLTSH